MTDEKKSYFPIRRIRLDDEVLKRWKSYKDKNCRTMNAVQVRLMDYWDKGHKKEIKQSLEIVGQNNEIVGQKLEGNKILDIFYEINKTIDYAKPFERRAAEWLINKFGLERVEKVARFACQVRGMPYAPRISKPTELKEKWADLETFALTKKNEAQSKNLVINDPSV